MLLRERQLRPKMGVAGYDDLNEKHFDRMDLEV
jgi:hypothetical protein